MNNPISLIKPWDVSLCNDWEKERDAFESSIKTKVCKDANCSERLGLIEYESMNDSDTMKLPWLKGTLSSEEKNRW